ncbi:MAG: hypothetical protein ACJ746_23720 [Bryobacteraceae bacterium]
MVSNTPRNVTLPTTLERQGNFSQSVNNNGGRLTVKDPLTGVAFPGNIIPASRLYGPGVALLNLFPQPNATGQIGYNCSCTLIVKRRVKNMIEEEDSAHPLTDEQITARLQTEGIEVTRRIVAKYREHMQIPPTDQRRQ